MSNLDYKLCINFMLYTITKHIKYKFMYKITFTIINYKIIIINKQNYKF